MDKKEYFVAIDLGSSDIVVAVGSHAGRGKITIESVAIKPSKGVVRGEVKNVEQAAQSIKEAVEEVEQELGIKILEAYTGISGSHLKCAKHPYYVYVASKDQEVSEEDVEKLNQSMEGVQAPDGYKLLHIVPQHYLVDEEEEVADPVGMFGQTLGSTFYLIIGENNIVPRLEKALQKIDIKQVKLFINPLAMADAVTFPDEKDLGVAVVDMGAGTTDICIYKDGIVRYVGVIPIGAETINKDIRAFGIMERYVEELKLNYGCAVADLVGNDLIKVPGRTPNDHKSISFHTLASIIEARSLDIIDYVMEEIRISGYEGKLGAGLILTGGSAQLKEIKTLFERQTKLDVRVAIPEVLVDSNSRERVNDTRLAVAVGIINYGVRSGVVTKTEELPASQRKKSEHKTLHPPVEQGNTVGDKDEDEDDFTKDDDEDTRQRRGKKERRDSDEEPRRGLFGRLKDRANKLLDFDVIEDENTGI